MILFWGLKKIPLLLEIPTLKDHLSTNCSCILRFFSSSASFPPTKCGRFLAASGTLIGSRNFLALSFASFSALITCSLGTCRKQVEVKPVKSLGISASSTLQFLSSQLESAKISSTLFSFNSFETTIDEPRTEIRPVGDENASSRKWDRLSAFGIPRMRTNGGLLLRHVGFFIRSSKEGERCKERVRRLRGVK
jgi:hypothetical protein